MDSLLATYASSDEEEEEEEEEEAPQEQNTASKSSSLFSALPQPKSSSLFSSLRNPKEEEEEINPTKPSSFFSSLPQPKTQTQQQPISIPKRVVQFKPPINPSSFKPTNSDEDEEEIEERKKPRETESLTVTSFLSTIPPPRNSSTLGLFPPSSSSSGSGRRSILETEPPVSASDAVIAESESGNNQNVADYVHYDRNTGDYVNYATYDQNVSSGDAALSYGSYDNYGSYGDYGNNWADGSASMVPHTTAAAVVSDSVVRVPGKRRRNEIPMEIVEVKQDELMKGRPREDQVKLTGIAFGPSYQPVSTKGKPSKIHKRKHQIGTLYYDMKQREMELSERRAKGFLTKAETQAKYGW